ncbi:AraC family transcriptional regulator, partial [Salmonella enterica subsp. enterica serovar Weltevreden]|nr:AraC family transcriptional regulator [Salmonella enterica subsp. enterica serovar Weltevreden]
DQAHLIHEFRALTGLTPGEYAAARTAVDHGYVPYRRA